MLCDSPSCRDGYTEPAYSREAIVSVMDLMHLLVPQLNDSNFRRDSRQTKRYGAGPCTCACVDRGVTLPAQPEVDSKVLPGSRHNEGLALS